ncbi:MAG: RNA 3'-terminal phosphate cyclase [Deltaproteobacteria bacterium]
MIVIDGAMGEGGGQIVRSALALSLVTGKPFAIHHIRAARKKPGLARQHLVAVNAAAQIGQGEVLGNELGSLQLEFYPGQVQGGSFHFDIGSAGSTTLVLQTLLPALLTASQPSTIELTGGTHNPLAPPFDFLATAYVPLINRMGPVISLHCDQRGFFPRGGGRLRAAIQPTASLTPLELLQRGPILQKNAVAVVAGLPTHIAERELKVVREQLDWQQKECRLYEDRQALGPGNVLLLQLASESITEVFSGFGEKGVPAEEVAADTIRQVKAYLNAGVPVGRRLADQLLLPLALAGGSRFLTMPLSGHAKTNIEVVRKFLDIGIETFDSGNAVEVVLSV